MAITDRTAQMFPRLTPAQIDRISGDGQRRNVRAGEVLFEVGEQNTPLFVVVSGAVAVVRLIGDREEPGWVYQPGEFTGEVNMLSARRNLERVRVSSDGEVIVVDRAALHTLVQRDAELSEILMRAFILRRGALISADNNDLVLLGSRQSGSTQRIRDFLSRNGQPFTYEDVETDPSAQELLDRFHIGVNDVPVLVCSGGHLLKNPTIESLASQIGLSAEFDPKEVRDVVIVGAGPAGLSAAVYGASEGLDVLWRARLLVGRRAQALASRTTLVFRPGSPGRRCRRARSCRQKGSGPRSPSAARSPASTATGGLTAFIWRTVRSCELEALSSPAE